MIQNFNFHTKMQSNKYRLQKNHASLLKITSSSSVFKLNKFLNVSHSKNYHHYSSNPKLQNLCYKITFFLKEKFNIAPFWLLVNAPHGEKKNFNFSFIKNESFHACNFSSHQTQLKLSTLTSADILHKM